MVGENRWSNIVRGWRRLLALAIVALVVLAVASGRLPTEAAPVAPATRAEAAQSAQSAQAAQIVAIAREAMEKNALKAVILRVTVDGQEVVTAALGGSMTGVPATTDMRFRNGAVSISYVATLLLRLVDQGVVRLDDPLSIWMPELPDSDTVTLRMLANLTAGYPDYAQNPRLTQELYANPFKQWTPEELIALGLSTPRAFAPGTNWDYSHTDYVILALALEKATGRPMAELLQEQVLDPLGLTNTVNWYTPAIPAPVLHAFSSERRQALGIPTGTRFYEESTFWNPSWTIRGATQTSTIYDMTATAVAVGEGTLLSPASHQAMVAPSLLGFGSPLAGCANCRTLNQAYSYGLGVIISGSWLLQNPLFGGYAAVEAYLPSKKIAIAVAVTFSEEAFDEQGNYTYFNAAPDIFAAIGALLAPEDSPLGAR
ncbi:MAG: serine hydrolase domain-containing protein [Dehalococcoidia bacterium]